MATLQGHLAAWRGGGGAGNRKGRREASKEDTRVLSAAAAEWAAEAGVTGTSSIQPEGSRELRGQEASGDTHVRKTRAKFLLDCPAAPSSSEVPLPCFLIDPSEVKPWGRVTAGYRQATDGKGA